MKTLQTLVVLGITFLIPFASLAQVSVPLPGRVINKLVPDYGRPKVYA